MCSSSLARTYMYSQNVAILSLNTKPYSANSAKKGRKINPGNRSKLWLGKESDV